MARLAPFPIRWAKAVLASELGKREKLVCFALHAHMDKKGICRPSVTTIATLSGYHRSKVFEALNMLEVGGWITRSTGASGRANRYAGLIPTVPQLGDTPCPVARGHEESKKSEELQDEFGGF